MTERPIMNSPEPAGRGTWLDAYMPEQLPSTQQAAPQMININLVRGILYRQRWLVAGVLFAAVTLLAMTAPAGMARARSKAKPA